MRLFAAVADMFCCTRDANWPGLKQSSGMESLLMTDAGESGEKVLCLLLSAHGESEAKTLGLLPGALPALWTSPAMREPQARAAWLLLRTLWELDKSAFCLQPSALAGVMKS